MPTRIDTGPFDHTGRLRSMVQSDPEAVEAGFRLLDTDLDAGGSCRIDLFGVDARGELTIIAVADGDPDLTLARLLDGYRWAVDHHVLLRRAYRFDGSEDAGSGSSAPSFRLLILAADYSVNFLDRLSLLRVPVTAYLARPVELRGERLLLVEPAAAIIKPHTPAGGVEPTPLASRLENSDIDRSGEPAIGPPEFPETPMEEAERVAFETLGHLTDIEPPLATVASGAANELFTETLTPEELKEFENFETQRQSREPEIE